VPIRRALLVGINSYPTKPLRGCVNDCATMKYLLTHHFDFPEEDIYVLLEGEASRSAIINGINWLSNGGGDADAVRVFFFSGHGTYAADQEGDEPDGRDECLLPADAHRSGPLTDDRLRQLYALFPKHVNLTLIMDCCHSGDIQKDSERDIVWKFQDVGDEEQRRIDQAARLYGQRRLEVVREQMQTVNLDILDDEQQVLLIQELMEKYDLSRHQEVNVNQENILLAACRSDSKSADAMLSGDYHGAFTFSLERAVTAANGSLTYRQLVQQAGKNLDHLGLEQEPQLETRQEFFEHGFLKPFHIN
jgi:hypothetical protein